MRPRLFFYVQHLLGIGHVVRALRVAAALAQDFDLRLVTGGDLPPGLVPPGLDILALDPVRAGPSGFSSLVHADGRPFEPAAAAARRDQLLAAFCDFAPDVLVTEAFPFGRRQMRFELLPLLAAAGALARRPLVAASIRDILQEMRPERQAETVSLVEQHYDLVLVHGDPSVIRLEDTFPPAAHWGERVAYTGLVGPPRPAPGSTAGTEAPAETFDVIVSVGGGAVGARLVEAALAARPLTRAKAARWLVLTGPNGERGPAPDAAVTLRPFAADLPALLARAQLSVCQAGYNTVADLLAAGCRAVLVPFAAGGETEQTRRADSLARSGRAVALPEADLTPQALAAAVDRALEAGPFAPQSGLDGAARCRDILVRALAGHRRHGLSLPHGFDAAGMARA